jgi:hypothetical protein
MAHREVGYFLIEMGSQIGMRKARKLLIEEDTPYKRGTVPKKE